MQWHLLLGGPDEAAAIRPPAGAALLREGTSVPRGRPAVLWHCTGAGGRGKERRIQVRVLERKMATAHVSFECAVLSANAGTTTQS